MDSRRFFQLGAAALAIILCLSFMACSGPDLSPTNFGKVKTGMTLDQVQKILGEPTESSSVDLAGFSGTVSKWKRGDVTVSIQFVNGKVVAKQFSKGND